MPEKGVEEQVLAMERLPPNVTIPVFIHRGRKAKELKQMSTNILYCLKNLSMILFAGFAFNKYPLQKKKIAKWYK